MSLLAALLAATMAPLPVEGELPSFGGASGWLNSQPLTKDGLRGKVVLVDFWTYTCINWLRTLPYVRAWAGKYKEQGLVVIGVHTPEFRFEKDLDNVRRAVKDRKIDFPVAIDNDYGIWRAFENHYWPALYLIDAHAKAYGRSPRGPSHDEMKIAGVKAVRDLPVDRVQHRGLFPHRPLTGKGPLIEPQPRRESRDARLVQC